MTARVRGHNDYRVLRTGAAAATVIYRACSAGGCVHACCLFQETGSDLADDDDFKLWNVLPLVFFSFCYRIVMIDKDDSSVVTLTMINTQTTFHLLLHTYKSMHQHIVETSVTSKTTNNTMHIDTTTSENTIKHTIMPTETTDYTL